jgi:hypothetical protein
VTRDKQAGNRPPTALDGQHPLVVPVLSAAGGVGRSTVAAQLAVALIEATTDSQSRAVAICDCQPRCASPWPGWLDHTAEHGTGWLQSCPADQFSREMRRSTSAVDLTDARQPLWVLADTGPLAPAFAGAEPGPASWQPVLRYLRAAVIDADPLEGFRLARQHAGGELSTVAAWLAVPAVRTAAVWVTDVSPAGLARTLDAMTAAESCGLPMRQVVVAISDCRGHGWPARSRSRRMLLADRVGAIVELDHDPALRRDGWPCGQPSQRRRRDVAALAAAVLAAGDQVASPADARELAWPERSARHVAATARAVPANG